MHPGVEAGFVCKLGGALPLTNLLAVDYTALLRPFRFA
jgi:hypothetical protein